MQRFTIVKGATSQIIPISIYDSSSTIGAKLAGLVFNTASLTAYYNRMGASGAATVITMVTATKGTWVSSGFVAIDGTNMPGDYELHLPDAVVASGVDRVAIQLKGAANMVPVNIEIDLVAFDLQTASVPQSADNDTKISLTALASVCSETRLAELDAGNLPTDVAAIDTATMRGTDSANTVVPASLSEFNARSLPSASYALEASLFDPTAQMTEGYAVDGVAPTFEEFQYMIWSLLNSRVIVGTVLSAYEIDMITVSMTFTLDDGTNPTDQRRAT